MSNLLCMHNISKIEDFNHTQKLIQANKGRLNIFVLYRIISRLLQALMNTQRITQLKAFLEESPEDPFLLYALATEHLTEAPSVAWEYFELLIAKHPTYVATYYHAAHLAWELEEIAQAKNIFEKGIAMCEQQGEHHHLRELKNAYQNFLLEEE